MSQTAARQEVENFYFMINQWKETRTLIESHLHSLMSESNQLEVLQELDKMEGMLMIFSNSINCLKIFVFIFIDC